MGYATPAECTGVWEAQFATSSTVRSWETSSLPVARTSGAPVVVWTMLLPQRLRRPGSGAPLRAFWKRFLQLSAEHNIQVCVPSTPAQELPHGLRRQVKFAAAQAAGSALDTHSSL